MGTLTTVDFVSKMAAYVADLRAEIRQCDKFKDNTRAKVYRSKLCSAYEICGLFGCYHEVFAQADKLVGEAEWK